MLLPPGVRRIQLAVVTSWLRLSNVAEQPASDWDGDAAGGAPGLRGGKTRDGRAAKGTGQKHVAQKQLPRQLWTHAHAHSSLAPSSHPLHTLLPGPPAALLPSACTGWAAATNRCIAAARRFQQRRASRVEREGSANYSPSNASQFPPPASCFCPVPPSGTLAVPHKRFRASPFQTRHTCTPSDRVPDRGLVIVPRDIMDELTPPARMEG